ncbi:MAG: cation:proton antiporter [Nitrososphaerota archaeon]|nr:cation:proton antiporter [Nitrososphaerota archaeon]
MTGLFESLFAGIPASALPLAYLGLLLIGAKLGEEAFRRLGLIPFVGAIFVGTLVGPGAFGFINVVPSTSLFIGLGINFLLFVSGAVEFESTRFRSILRNKTTVPLAVLQFTTRFLGITAISFLLFREPLPAIVIGIVAGMSSAGPLSRLLTDTGLAKTDEGTAIFSQVVIIEIAAVVLFSFVYDLAGKAITAFSIASVALEVSLTIIGIIIFGRYVFVPLLEKVETHFHGREAVFAIIMAFILLLGFLGEITGFNSAIVALFLGLLLQNFFAARPVLLEKVSAFTYGFFEPLFFVGLGLYFVRVTPYLLLAGLVIFGMALGLDAIVGAVTSKAFKVGTWRNAFGTCVNGGVDAALLVTALTAGTALIGGFSYSATAIGIALLSLVAPLLFRLRTPLVEVDKESGTRKIVKQQLDTLTAGEICQTLPTVSTIETDPVKKGMKQCLDLDARAAVVLNSKNEPVATLLLRDVLTMSNREISRLKVIEAPLAEAIKVTESEPALKLAGIFKETNIPIIAVVDKDGKLIGTILEREILRRMMTSLEE